MRVSIEDAIHGGKSDPRNQTLVKMFTLLGLVERAGSGVPNIFSIWQSQGWDPPVLKEEFNPDRTTLSLSFFASGQKVAIPSGSVKKPVSGRQKEILINAVSNGESIRTAQVVEMLGVGASRARKLLAELMNEDILVASGAKKDRVYWLKKIGSNNVTPLLRVRLRMNNNDYIEHVVQLGFISLKENGIFWQTMVRPTHSIVSGKLSELLGKNIEAVHSKPYDEFAFIETSNYTCSIVKYIDSLAILRFALREQGVSEEQLPILPKGINKLEELLLDEND